MAAQLEGGVPVALEQDGTAALTYIKQSEPVAWLAAHDHLSHSTRRASEYVFSLAKEYAAHCPLPHLLTLNFDSEQIWQQIDLQATPLLAAARRRLRHLQLNTDSVVLLDGVEDFGRFSSNGKYAEASQMESEDAEEQEIELEGRETNDEEDDDEEDDLESEPDEDGEGHAVEDKFFKLKDMERFLDEAEAPQDDASLLHLESEALESEEEEEEEEVDEGEDSDMDGDDMEDDDVEVNDRHNVKEDLLKSKDKDLKYEDFFGGSKKKKAAGVSRTDKSSQPQAPSAQFEPLTAHEKQLAKVQKRITELESANLDSKLWTMQGEVSAAKRPKNSALEVELDFEHNVRPPPVITEEVTASLEDLIRNRIAENNFDDVQRKPSLPLHAPKEKMELDENKSKKGLAELYEADYMQKTGLAPISSTPADELRKEATQLFKALCIKLDALSHFHFTPKPVIEDMGVRSDVPALAMEEVAPLMVSDAQMLAPEEHFTGEGVVKADAEISREERKRHRARNKEKARAEKRKELYKKPGLQTPQSEKTEVTSLPRKRKTEQSHYSKSLKVFGQLDEANKNGKEKPVESQDVRAPFLKL